LFVVMGGLLSGVHFARTAHQAVAVLYITTSSAD